MLGDTLHLRRNVIALVQNTIDGFHDGNIGFELLVHLVDTAAGEITLRNHVHLKAGHTH